MSGSFQKILVFLTLFASGTVVGMEYSIIEVYQGHETIPSEDPPEMCAIKKEMSSPYAWTLRQDIRKSVLDGKPTALYAPTLVIMGIKNDGDKDCVFSLANLKNWKMRIEGAETAREIPLLSCWEDDLKKEYVIRSNEQYCIPIGSHEWVLYPYIKRIMAFGDHDSCESKKYGTLLDCASKRLPEGYPVTLPDLKLIRIMGMREDGKLPKTLLRREDGIGYSVAENSSDKFVAGVAVLLVSNKTLKQVVVPRFEGDRWRIRLRRSKAGNDVVVSLVSGKFSVSEDSFDSVVLNPNARIGVICGVLGMERLIRKGDVLSVEFDGKRVTNELVF